MESKSRFVYDIETLADVFTATFEDYDTGEVIVFECSRFKNELPQLITFWSTIRFLIAFNSEHFDNVVIHKLFEAVSTSGHDPAGLPGEQIAQYAYGLAQRIISDAEHEDVRNWTWATRKELKLISIDLFLFWSRMLRLSKKLSLKFFAHNLGMNILEMPIHHTATNLTREQIDEVITYNKQDVAVTTALAKELREQINLRGWIGQNYKLPCFSKDAPKIAQELILDSYCRQTGQPKKKVKNRRYVKPDPLALATIVPEVTFKTPFFQQVYTDIQKSINGFSNEYLYRNPDNTFIKLSYGVGGLHSINKNEAWYSSEKTQIYTIDVASLYPTLILEYGYISKQLGTDLLDVYRQIKEDRLKAKKEKDKQKDTLLKLCLNGFSGLADSPTCWLYSPEEILAMRIHGQLLLSRTIEELGLAGIHIISANTDGIECQVVIGEEENLFTVVSGIEAEFRVQFEYEKYKAVYYKTVNDYLAITESGKTKKKGEFISEKVLDGSNEFLVIPKALEAYWVQGISPELFIRNHSDVFGFCAAKKIDRNYMVWYRGEQQQQLNRYLVSTKAKGAYLYKQKLTDKKGQPGKLENVLKELPVVLVNEACTKPAQQYPISYTFYIQKVWEIIRLFEPQQLSLSFTNQPQQLVS